MFAMFATEDWAQGWELHRPSARPSSSDMLIVAAVAALPAGSPPCGFWAVLRETGTNFAMGSGLLGGIRRGLFAVGSADLGKRRRVVVFRASSACKTAQKLQVGFVCAGDWSGQGFLDGMIGFFRQRFAPGRMGRYGRLMSVSSACCSEARCA